MQQEQQGQADAANKNISPILFLETRGFKAYLPILIVATLIFIIAAFQFYWSATDPARYQCYALTFWSGSHITALLPAQQCSFLKDLQPAPFRILPREYPPLTLVPFSLPLLLPIPYYQLTFTLLMTLLIFFIYWLLLRVGPPGAAFAYAGYLLIGACALATMRYDLIPALCCLMMLIAAARKRWTLAYVALAFGVLFKIYPIIFLPSLFIAEQQDRKSWHTPPERLTFQQVPGQIWYTLRGLTRWHWRNCLTCLLLIFAVTGIFALVNFYTAVVSQVQYFMQRPIQVESTLGTLVWLAHLFGGSWQGTSYTFGSININSSLDNLISPVGTICLILGILYVLWLQWRGRMDIAQVTIALTLLFIVTGKVFSPQYLLWLIPLLAFAGYFKRFWLLSWSTISVLTTFIYAFFYKQVPSAIDGQLVPMPTGFFPVTALRNICLLALTLVYLFNWFQIRTQKKPSTTLVDRDVPVDIPD